MQPGELKDLGTVCTALCEKLEMARDAVLRELRDYPRPIAGCDQQFNHLLATRDAMARDMGRIRDLAASTSPTLELRRQIDDYIRSCSWIDNAARDSLRSRLGAGMPALG